MKKTIEKMKKAQGLINQASTELKESLDNKMKTCPVSVSETEAYRSIQRASTELGIAVGLLKD